MKKVIKPAAILFIIVAIVTGALAFANYITKDIIAERKLKEAKEARQAVMQNGVEFLEIEKDKFNDKNVEFSLIEEVYSAYNENEELIGIVVSVRPSGYGGEVKITAGIQEDGTLENIVITEHEETPGLGAKATEDKFISQFKNMYSKNQLVVVKTEPSLEGQIEAISGATITSDAVVRGVNEAKKIAELVFSDEEAYIE